MIEKVTSAAEAKVRAPRTVQAKVRMPVALHRKLMRDAERSGQTLNAEILRRLEESYRTDDTLKDVSETLKEVRTDLSQRNEEMRSYTRIVERWVAEMAKTKNSVLAEMAKTKNSVGNSND